MAVLTYKQGEALRAVRRAPGGSTKRLAAIAGLTLRQIAQGLYALQQLGVIRREPNKGIDRWWPQEDRL